MKGIKLTPFLLFVMLLVVLVFAMIFGSYMNPIVENMVNSGLSSSWKPVTTGSVAQYNNGAELDTIIPPSDDKQGVFYDTQNGSVIIAQDVASSSFTVLPRDSMGVPETVDNDSNIVKTNIDNVDAPWTYVMDNNVNENISVLYAPNKANTLVILIDNDSNQIKQVFKSSKGISTSILPVNLDTGILNNVNTNEYSKSGLKERIRLKLNGKKIDATKIAKDLFYSDKEGIIVGKADIEQALKSSDHFKDGLTRLNTDESLILGALIDESNLLNVVIVKEPGSGIYKLASSTTIPYSYPDGNPNDSASITVTTGDDSASGAAGAAGAAGASGSNGSNGSNGSAPGTDVNLCPRVVSDVNSESKCDDSDYIRRTEIVPPVCPMCPSYTAQASTCNLSIDKNGEMVDCTGKKYQPSQGVYGASPGTFDGSLGSSVENVVDDIADVTKTGITETGDVLNQTVDTAGNIVDKTVDTAGDVVDKTLDTAGDVVDKTVDSAGNVLDKTVDSAGNVLNKTVDSAGNLLGGVGDTLGDVASGLGQGLSGLGQGASGVIQGVSSDVAGLGGNIIDSTTGLIKDTGSGFMQLTEQQQQFMLQQQQMAQQGQGMMPQGYGGMPQQGYGGMPQQGYGYSYPQQCANNESNFMPITSDFSQFT